MCIDSRWIRAMVKAREPRRPTFLPFRPLVVHPLVPRQLGWRATKWPRVSSVGFARAARGTALHRFWTCSRSRGGIHVGRRWKWLLGILRDIGLDANGWVWVLIDFFFYLALFIIPFSKLVYDIAREILSSNYLIINEVLDEYLFSLEKK